MAPVVASRIESTFSSETCPSALSVVVTVKNAVVVSEPVILPRPIVVRSWSCVVFASRR